MGLHLLPLLTVSGIGIAIIYIIKWLNSGAGNTISQLFGSVASIIQGLVNLANDIIGSITACFTGSESTGDRAKNCGIMIGILTGIGAALYIVCKIAAKAKDMFNPKSEMLKSLEQQMKDNISNFQKQDIYNTLKDSLTEMFKNAGKSESEAEILAESLINAKMTEKAAERMSSASSDAAKKSKNTKDADAAAENAQIANAKQIEAANLIKSVGDFIGEDGADNINDVFEKNNDAIEKSLDVSMG